MNAFDDDLAENMKSPEFAYEYGRAERELEIIKLLEELTTKADFPALDPAGQALRTIDWAIALIKGENK